MTTAKRVPGSLSDLAARAGLELDWEDATGRSHHVSDDTARTLLDALGLASDTPSRLRQSIATLDAEVSGRKLPPLITAEVGRAIALRSQFAKDGTHYRIELENGGVIDGYFSVPRGEAALLSPIAETGYHTLILNEHRTTLAVAPLCYTIADALRDAGTPARGDAGALFGVAVQAYSLRRPRDGGIGDYTALSDFARKSAAHHADILAVSPLHAMFSAQPHKSSPYSPSSRIFLNVLHIDPAAVFGADAARAAIDRLHLGDELAQLDLAELIDWPRAAVAKLAVLAELFDRFTSTDGSGAHAELRFDFRHFCERGGQRLEDHARHEAIHAAQLALDPARDHWRDWPAELRDPRNAAVEAFAQTNRHDVDFHLFLQWLAARGLAQAQRDARDAGMAIGLIADLAVGCDSAGSHAWSYQHDMLQRVSVGAPPDLFNQGGQSWGLTTFSPRAMRTSGFVAFIDMLRAAFAHAGGVRIDHILGLRRLWLVPEGHSAKDGAYLRYPLDDLLRLIALESWRHRAIVIGEDLGTVPAGFRERLADAGLLGIRVLWFERDDGTPPGFLAPSEWGRKVTASTTTHDLPTVAGWWQGRDIDARARIGQTAPLAEEDEGPASLEHSRSRDGRAAEAPAEQRTAAPHGDRLAAAVRHATPDPPAAAQPRADPRALHADPRVAKAIARASAERAADRAALWRAFQLAGVAPAEVSPPPLDEAPVDEALRFVARTRAPLVTCPLEDLIGSAEQPNLPGSTHEYPNWQRRIAASVDELFQDDTFVDRLAAVDAARRQD